MINIRSTKIKVKKIKEIIFISNKFIRNKLKK